MVSHRTRTPPSTYPSPRQIPPGSPTHTSTPPTHTYQHRSNTDYSHLHITSTDGHIQHRALYWFLHSTRCYSGHSHKRNKNSTISSSYSFMSKARKNHWRWCSPRHMTCIFGGLWESIGSKWNLSRM